MPEAGLHLVQKVSGKLRDFAKRTVTDPFQARNKPIGSLPDWRRAFRQAARFWSPAETFPG
jgi:hypothetical protein